MTRKDVGQKIAALNRKARHDYFIEEEIEAGIMLTGSEVKALRAGKANIADAYASDRDGEFYLFGAHISPYEGANQFNHEPLRPRKLLLHKKEVGRLMGAISREGMTVVPLSVYFNARGRAKALLGLAKGKKKIDKRETAKERDWNREKARVLRNKS